METKKITVDKGGIVEKGKEFSDSFLTYFRFRLFFIIIEKMAHWELE